eukprot:g6815.t1
MVQFGATLERQKNQDWKEFYIDYRGLKKQLKRLKAAYEAASTIQRINQERQRILSWEASPTQHSGAATTTTPGAGIVSASSSSSLVGGARSLRRRLTDSYSLAVGEDVDEVEEKFKAALDAEVEKVVLFFLSKQGELAQQLLDARQASAPPNQQGSSGSVGEGYYVGDGRGDAAGAAGAGAGDGGLVAIARETERHGIYCGIGRQIAELLRFLQLNVSGLRKILKKHDKQIRDKMIAKNYLSTRAQEKYSAMRQLYNNSGVLALVGSLRNAFEAEEAQQARMARPSAMADEEAGLLRSARATRRTLSEVSSTQGVLIEIANEQRALAEAQHLTTSAFLSLQVLLDGSGLSTLDEDSEREPTNRELHKPSAFINLTTTFLYMTNYYIVGPTSAEYAAALGGSPAISGLIIGMTPIAACFSCLLYSWWTNTSFRGPLLLCSVLLIVGNFLYGLALTYDAFWMVLVGRMLIGLGGARGVNRRYIADTIPIVDRTAYSAAFVAAGAVGMAFGPAISAVFNGINFSVAGVKFNGLTNPGWIMFVLWVILGWIIQTEFREPSHYLSGGFDLGSDEEPSASKTPTHARLLRNHAAVAGESGKLASTGGDAAVAYGSTATATAAVAGIENGGEPADHESSKLLDGGAAGAAGAGAEAEDEDEDEDEDDADEDVEYGSGGDLSGAGRKKRCGGLGAITPPLGFCLFGYFVNKLITEAVMSSAPVLTQNMFDWSVGEVGMLMAVLGLVVLPVNATVGRLSTSYEDRVLLQALAVLAGIGCLVIVDFNVSPFEYTEAQYIVGVSLIFVAMQAHEGVVMSITSKIIPVELARGTWNSGFLATEAGTFGRFVGDALITVLGVMTLSWLDFLLFLPSALLVLVMIGGFFLVYPFLQGQ